METTQTNLLWAVRDSRRRGLAKLLPHLFGHGDPVCPPVGALRRRCRGRHPGSAYPGPEVAPDRGIRSGQGGFRQWLYGIARRRSLAAMRARCRRTRAQWVRARTGPISSSGSTIRAARRPIASSGSRRWRYALLDEALRYVEHEVGEKAVQAFNLLALKNWPVEQVATQLGIAPSSVYVYKHRVLHAVKEYIARFESDEK